MKKKLLISFSMVAMLVLAFLFYTNNSSVIADDKDGKDCSSKCTQKSSTTDQTMGGANSSETQDGLATYEFVTDQISCDGCKPGMSESLMGISGVKEISYGETCNVSKMTSVKVIYSAEETTPEIISASVKEKGLQGKCGDGSKCDSKKSTKKS
ncbi:MAG TPA: hypothetical protein PKA90_04435 [Ignavibacteria bacterium]|nr:hypothetical protein [Ignavibacteria bacterium]HMR39657.1 hypothetical protein [Ignavibacteria bacterium]